MQSYETFRIADWFRDPRTQEPTLAHLHFREGFKESDSVTHLFKRLGGNTRQGWKSSEELDHGGMSGFFAHCSIRSSGIVGFTRVAYLILCKQYPELEALVLCD
jgi:hypothetical protein